MNEVKEMLDMLNVDQAEKTLWLELLDEMNEEQIETLKNLLSSQISQKSKLSMCQSHELSSLLQSWQNPKK